MKRGKLSDINEISKIYIYKGNDGSGKQIYSQELQNFKASNNILTVSGENDNANIFFNNNDSEEEEENTNMDNMKDINYNAFNMDNNWDEISTTLVDDESKNNISIFNENYEDKISPDTTSELISDSLNHFAGDLGYDIYNMDIEELVSKIINDINNNYSLDYSFEPETNDMEEYSKWYDSIEAEVLKQLKNDQLKEDTNINIDKVEIDIDELDNEYNKVDDEASCYDCDDSFDYDRDELKDEFKEAASMEHKKYIVFNHFSPDYLYLIKNIPEDSWIWDSDWIIEDVTDKHGQCMVENNDEDIAVYEHPQSLEEVDNYLINELKKAIQEYPDDDSWEIYTEDGREFWVDREYHLDNNGIDINNLNTLDNLKMYTDMVENSYVDGDSSSQYQLINLDDDQFTNYEDSLLAGDDEYEDEDLDEALTDDQKYPIKSPIAEAANNNNDNDNELKWNIGSDKSNINDEEMSKLEELAKMLQDNSPNNWKYTVEKTYEDFGAGMQWYTIICHDRSGDSWQVLNTKEWLDLMNTGDIEATYSEVINGKYFQDKKQKGKIDIWKWDI